MDKEHPEQPTDVETTSAASEEKPPLQPDEIEDSVMQAEPETGSLFPLDQEPEAIREATPDEPQQDATQTPPDDNKPFSQYPLNKILTLVGILFFVILGIIYLVHQRHQKNLRIAAASTVISAANPLQDIQNYIGLPITIKGNVEGTVSENVQEAMIHFKVSGTKGKGEIVASLEEGQLTGLMLTMEEGDIYNVLIDQRNYLQKQAAQLALTEKQTAIKNNFSAAVQALDAKAYQQAISGFLQSIGSNYNVAKSSEYLGFSYSQTNDYDNCIVYYSQYIKLQGDDPEAYYQLAYCHLELYQTADALVNLDKSCQLGYAMACSAGNQIREQLKNKPAPATAPQTPVS